jgi:hypothetical protein
MTFDESERMWKEPAMAYFKIVSKSLPVGIEEKYEAVL